MATWVPYAGAGSHLFDSLRVYAEHWRYNDIAFYLVQLAVPEPRRARIAALLLTGVACLTIATWRRSLEHPSWPRSPWPSRSRQPFTRGICCGPSPSSRSVPSPALIAWSGTVSFSYLYLDPAFGIGPFAKEAWGPRGLQIGSVLLAIGTRGRAATRTQCSWMKLCPEQGRAKARPAPVRCRRPESSS